ncbi:MAG: hypothetical protein J2P50_08490 [Hyphomicrobiaceae bacterium]|nr:hypothetical protein [Hyphomicrobiaceae bacterium]
MVVLSPKTRQAMALSVSSAWRQSQRTTRSEAEMLAAGGEAPRHGILMGVWDEGDVSEEL